MRTLEEIIQARIADFHATRINCAESVLLIMSEYYGWDNPAIPRIATAFGGGIAGMQGACGVYTGGAMVIGMLLGREVGGDRAPAVTACKALRTYLMERHGAFECKAILQDVDMSDPAQNETFRAPGGKHETLCEPLVAATCRFLARQYPRES